MFGRFFLLHLKFPIFFYTKKRFNLIELKIPGLPRSLRVLARCLTDCREQAQGPARGFLGFVPILGFRAGLETKCTSSILGGDLPECTGPKINGFLGGFLPM